MGFSTSGAAAIIFIGLLVAVSIVYPTLETAHDRRADAIDDRDDRALDLRNADIELDASYDDAADELVVNVTNTGVTTLSVNDTDLLVDGVLEAETTSAVGNGDDYDPARERVHSGEVLRITVAGVETTPDRVKVVTEHGLARILLEVDNGQ